MCVSIGLKGSAQQRCNALGFGKVNRVFWLEGPAEVNWCWNPQGQARLGSQSEEALCWLSSWASKGLAIYLPGPTGEWRLES